MFAIFSYPEFKNVHTRKKSDRIKQSDRQISLTTGDTSQFVIDGDR